MEAPWLSIFTALLAGATVWLAIATHRMATATKEAVALEARPYLAFSGLRVNFFLSDPNAAPGSVKIALILVNPGKVLVQYNVKSLRMTVAGVTRDNPKFLTRGGTIFPGQQENYNYDLIENINAARLPINGVVEFEIEYQSGKHGSIHTAKARLRYSVLSLEPPGGHLEWSYLEEPEYT